MNYIDEFEKYVSNYDLNDENIKLKYDHSFRVMNLSEKYAKLLGFNDEDIKLAKLIGLLHDIGRFEQLRIYNTYDDNNSIDHADYSVEQLFDKGLINKFWDNENDYEIIKYSIKNHNKYVLKEIDNERALMHAKLIRDTDKLDIVFLLGYLKQLKKEKINIQLSTEVTENFMNNKCVEYKYVKNSNDRISIYFAFAFDIYNDICLDEFKNNLQEYYLELNNEEVFKNIYEIVIKYIDERIEGNVRK